MSKTLSKAEGVWTTDRLREAFLKYFAGKDHKVMPSASLNPASYGDRTTLLTTAGMQPFVPYFKGEQKPPHPRLASCQKCCRADDLEEVGHTSRHQTFFEMLGNFSFGDYFKEEAIESGWEFVTDVLGISKDLLWATVYETDDEAFEFWKRYLPEQRIRRFGKKDNWWGPVGRTGPCGPCSEINVDRGPEHGCGQPDCGPNCPRPSRQSGRPELVEGRCERFVEVWNLVFPQYNQQEDGSLPLLAAHGVDTGMGLERLAAVMQGVPTNHEIDIIRPICERVSELASSNPSLPAVRIIADHARAVTFMAADGIVPSNEGRGYVMRRILRRAARFGRQLGIESTFLHKIVPMVMDLMKQPYPELLGAHERIAKLVQVEEERFHEALEQGVNLLDEIIREQKEKGDKILPGEHIFRLYDTFGFPRELTEEIAREHGLEPDVTGFEKAMESQRERARSGGQFEYGERLGIREHIVPESLGAQPFVGYEQTEHESEVVWVGESTGTEGGDGETLVVLAETPFYGEAGGQVGDTGEMAPTANGKGPAHVRDTIRDDGVIVHLTRVGDAALEPGMTVRARVDADRRRAITRSHSATHLLHAALRKRLGTHVAQAGSLVEPDRLRFDFSHFGPLSSDDLLAIEEMINEKVLDSILVETLEDVPIDRARKMGAMMLFGEKYGDHVRVVKMSDFSIELCGGTHTRNTSQIGLVKIVSQSSVGANLRRVEAVTGKRAWEWAQGRDALIHQTAASLNVSPDAVVRSVERLLEERKRLEQTLHAMQQRMAASSAEEIARRSKSVDSIQLVAEQIEGLSADALRTLADQVADRINPGIVVLGSTQDGKVVIIAKATPDAVKRGAHAGNLVREIAKRTGGGGGGRPDFAQAGGKQPEKLREALTEAAQIVKSQIEQ